MGVETRGQPLCHLSSGSPAFFREHLSLDLGLAGWEPRDLHLLRAGISTLHPHTQLFSFGLVWSGFRHTLSFFGCQEQNLVPHA